MQRISCLWLVATSVAALVLFVAPGGAVRTSSAAPLKSCGADSVRALISGRQRCLRWEMPCVSRLNAGYHRYLFHCSGGSLVYWWRGLLARPLRIPALDAGAACPTSEAQGAFPGGVSGWGGPAFGPGPAYPTIDNDGGRATLRYLLGWGYEGWDGTKVLWIAPRYRGPYIVRGRQLDGPNTLRFDQGPTWSNKLHAELRLVGPDVDLHPAATFLRAPGCYAYQVDGRGFSYVIVFEARPA